MEVILSAVLLLIGLVMLCFGGNWLVSGGVAIAKKFRISNLVIGMTIVAYGTSTPELAASIAAAGDHSAIILGNIVGSNIANVGMVIGVAAILVPLAVHKSVLRKEIPIMLGVSALLVFFHASVWFTSTRVSKTATVHIFFLGGGGHLAAAGQLSFAGSPAIPTQPLLKVMPSPREYT